MRERSCGFWKPNTRIDSTTSSSNSSPSSLKFLPTTTCLLLPIISLTLTIFFLLVLSPLLQLLKVQLKVSASRMIEDVSFDFISSLFFFSILMFYCLCTVSSNRKRKGSEILEMGVADSKLKRRICRLDSSDARVDIVIERAEACLRKIREIKESFLNG